MAMDSTAPAGARSGHELESESRLAARILQEQVSALYGKGGLALIANSVVGALVVLALWGEVRLPLALAWWAAMTAVVAIRLVLWSRFPRQAAERAAVPDPATWARRWVVGAGITGAIWGSAAIGLFPPEGPSQVVLIVSFAGMAAGSSTSASSYMPAFRAFAIPELVPLMIRLLWLGNRESLALAALVLFFGVAMDLVAQRGNRVLVEAIRLRLRNSLLLEELSEVQGHLVALNTELEERVEVRTEALRQALHAREELLSLVSHELRTPLTAMKLTEASVLELLERSEVPERLRAAFERFKRQTLRLNHLVDEMLDVGRLRKGGVSLNREPVRVAELVETAREELLPLIDKAAVDVQVHLEGDLAGNWDRQRMVQVLTNLLSNALKYGEGRPVCVRAEPRGDLVRISVLDEGPGIRPEDRERIFEPFERARARSGVAGLGLGLYIAKRLVLAHGGRLWAQARPAGTGSEFVLELPSLGLGAEARPP